MRHWDKVEGPCCNRVWKRCLQLIGGRPLGSARDCPSSLIVFVWLVHSFTQTNIFALHLYQRNALDPAGTHFPPTAFLDSRAQAFIEFRAYIICLVELGHPWDLVCKLNLHLQLPHLIRAQTHVWENGNFPLRVIKMSLQQHRQFNRKRTRQLYDRSDHFGVPDLVWSVKIWWWVTLT